MDTEDLLCTMICSWILLPAAGIFVVALYFIIGIPEVLLYILIIVFSVCFLTIALLITISYKTGKVVLYKIAYYISIPFLILSVLFFFGFVIGSFVHLIRNLKDFGFSLILKPFGVFFPFGLLFSMLLNVFTANKQSSEPLSEERIMAE